MAKDISQAKFVFICAGRKKGKCFPQENTEEVWKHLKRYRRKKGYEQVTLREAACLDICKEGPCFLVINENAESFEYRLGAQNDLEKAKKLVDDFMDDYIIDTTPPQ